MTIKLPFFLLLLSLFYACNGCNGTDKKVGQPVQDTTGWAIAQTVEPAAKPVVDTVVADDSEMMEMDSLNFAKYAVAMQKTSKADLDFSSYPEARAFKTRIIEGYKEMDVNFAGHYVAIYFGCGAGCIMGFMVDALDGKIYDLPLGEENMCIWSVERALYTATSRLFISAICKAEAEHKEVYYKASVWDEENKRFNELQREAFVIRKK